MKITFHGVRGSRPCSGPDFARIGGNTACVSVEGDGADPLLLDLGTGVLSWAAGLDGDGTVRASAFVTHAHWDHIQGLPYFSPATRQGTVLDVYGPPDEGMTLTDVFDRAVAPPLFPISWRELPGTIRFHDVVSDDFSVGAAKVRARRVPHPGTTVGFRIDLDGASVAYVSDHQMPADRSSVDPNVVELCDGVDLLIHDAQFTDTEFESKPDWGHCTDGYALVVAKTCNVRRLALFHHDPAHDDATVDAIVRNIEPAARSMGIEVFAAAEGSVVVLGSEG